MSHLLSACGLSCHTGLSWQVRSLQDDCCTDRARAWDGVKLNAGASVRECSLSKEVDKALGFVLTSHMLLLS